MSLINEALKKAQRIRTGDPAGAPPSPGEGGPRIAKRAQPKTAQQLVLIAAGAVVLVVLSVVVTVYLVNRSPAPKTVAITPPPTTSPTSSATPGPISVAPVIPPPAPAPKTPGDSAPVNSTTPAAENPATDPNLAPANTPATVASTPTPAESKSAPVPANDPALTPPPAPATAPVPSASGTAKPDERVSLFVDAIRVAGIRSSGNESRVLMNDRVFRLNEIVERNFGLRLTQVESGTLTFTDANGAVYVKNF